MNKKIYLLGTFFLLTVSLQSCNTVESSIDGKLLTLNSSTPLQVSSESFSISQKSADIVGSGGGSEVSVVSSKPIIEEPKDVPFHSGEDVTQYRNFRTLVEKNEIDIDYQDEIDKNFNYSNVSIQTNLYLMNWEREFKIAYDKLTPLLSDEDAKKLINSQKNWEQYISNEMSWRQNVLNDTSHFYEDNYALIYGRDNRFLLVEDKAELYRGRTLTILQYIFDITGKAELYYTQENRIREIAP